MGKGGCQTSIAADLGQLDAAAPGSSVLGFGAIISALQLITSSKWAETQIDPRSGEKAERSGEPSTVRPVHDCLKDGKIPWDVVRRHNHANSCWMVVRNKVCLRRHGQARMRCAQEGRARARLASCCPHMADASVLRRCTT